MKILILDIETAPSTAFVWKLWKENIPLQRLQESGYTLCWSAKWLDGKKVIYQGLDTNTKEELATKMYELLDEAEAVVHYNGKRFDVPILNKDFIMNGLTPPSPYSQIDLLSVVRSNFKFQSNKLDFVAQELGIGSKTKGMSFDVWQGAIDGDKKAWKLMKKYNKQDVLLTEKLYLRLLPWIKNHPSVEGKASETPTCSSCGSDHLQKRGFSYSHTRAYKWQRYQCMNCGAWKKGDKAKRLDNVLADAN